MLPEVNSIPSIHFPYNSVNFDNGNNIQIYSKIFIYDHFQREHSLFEGVLNYKFCYDDASEHCLYNNNHGNLETDHSVLGQIIKNNKFSKKILKYDQNHSNDKNAPSDPPKIAKTNSYYETQSTINHYSFKHTNDPDPNSDSALESAKNLYTLQKRNSFDVIYETGNNETDYILTNIGDHSTDRSSNKNSMPQIDSTIQNYHNECNFTINPVNQADDRYSAPGVNYNFQYEDPHSAKTMKSELISSEIDPSKKIDTECQVCGRRCRSVNALSHHMLVHSEDRPHACDICKKAFKEQPTLRRHLWTHMDKQHQCDICKKFFVEKSSLRRHMSTIHADFKPGVKYNQQNSKIHYSCDKCTKTFKSSTKYTMHYQMHGNPNYECNVCEKVYAGRSHLKIHQRIHTGEKPFVCNVCGAKFAFKHVLKSHQARIHYKINQYSCNLCSLTFLKKTDLSSHANCHMQNMRKGKRHVSSKYSKKCSSLEMRKVFEKNLMTYKNDQSQNERLPLFGQLVGLYPKMGEEDRVNGEAEITDSQVHVSSTVDTTISDTRLIKSEENEYHISPEQERKNKKCLKCLKVFERMGDLKRHLISHIVQIIDGSARSAFPSPQSYQCLLCSAPHFRQVDKFKAHLREHAMLTPYTCPLCHRAFGDSSNFSKHKKVHGNTFLQCDLCARKFNTRRMLILHMDYHQRHRPQKCPYCGRLFHFQSNLRKHLKMSHLGKVNVTYKCEFCGERFRSVKLKWEHQWEDHQHRKVQADCQRCSAKFRKKSLLKRHILREHFPTTVKSENGQLSSEIVDCKLSLLF